MPAGGDAAIVEPVDAPGWPGADAFATADAVLPAPTAGATAAGRTPAYFGVTSSGAATYRIPIWTPPGVGNAELDLALVYNSRSGNGVIGQGWSLSGLSAITRCNRTTAQDGAPAAVTNTLADRYCLDGQQLKLVSGTYGAPNSVYATEVESFSRIVASGSTGNGPAFFIVTSKNGLVFEYGSSGDSQVYAGTSGTVRTWALSVVRDRAATSTGNSITVTYLNDARNGAYTSGTFRVAEIAYPTTATGQGPFYRVSFDYSPRPATDPVAGYLAGHAVLELNKLDSITIRNNASGATIKAYKLAYSKGTASGRLQLRSVQECSATNCMAPTTIDYQQGATGWGAPVDTGIRSSAKASMRSVDLNGDGRSDLLYPIKQANGAMHWWVAFGQPGGFGPPVDTGVTADAGVKVIPGRFLGNDRMQFLVPQGATWTLFNYGDSTFQLVNTGLPLAGEYLAADIDGDGLDDLISKAATSPAWIEARRNTTVPVAGSVRVEFAPGRETIWNGSTGAMVGSDGYTNVADLNGDGRADLAIHTWVSTKRGGSWLTPLLSNGFGTPFTAGDRRDFWQDGALLVVDWNADGCSDFLQVSSVMISDCAGHFARVPTGATSIQRDGNGNPTILAADWDEDGRVDLLYVRSGGGSIGNTWYVVRSTGTGAAAPAPTGVSAPNKTAWLVSDIDGDAKPDLAYRDDGDNGKVRYRLHEAPGAPADLATTFTDGFGMSQVPRYASISTGNYTRHSDAVFPEVDFAGPLYVVAMVTTSDGTGGTYQNRFDYYGARVHLQGRGFEGFHSQRIHDTRNGTYTFDYLKRSFPFTGMHTQRTIWQSNLASKVSEWGATVEEQRLGAPGLEQRVFPYVATSTHALYEVGGSLNGTLVTEVSERNVYGDGYGNRTRVERAVIDRDPGSPFVNSAWQTTAASTFANDTIAHCLGLPTSVAVTQVVPGQAARTRTAAYTVDTGPCRITRQVLEPGSPALKVTTTLGFDACGNVSSLKVAGATPGGSSMPARRTRFDYGTRCQLPESMTDPLGMKTSVTYQYDFGAPLSSTDPNKITTSWQYDDFGRRVQETRPDSTSTAWSFESCAAGPCWGASDFRFHVYQTSKGSTSGVYDQREMIYDGFDRLRSSQYMRVHGAWVIETIQYDAFGRPVVRYQPTSGASNGHMGWTYDLLDRVTAQRLYQSNGALDRETKIGHAGRRALITDPLGRTRTRIMDVAGRLRRVVDPSPGGTTYYDYDSLGGLVRIQDPIGAVSSGTYNLRGFRTKWSDADRGTWTFGGNSLNELVSWTDARGRSFSANYDALGRQTSLTEPDGSSTWTWGSSAAAHNIGRLKSVSGHGYAESLGYDSVGRIANRSITTDQSYQYDYTYDTNGALDSVEYPVSPVPAGQGGARFKVRYAYSYGAPVSIIDVTQSPARPLWRLNSANDYSSATSETLGADVVAVASARKPWSNELASRQSGVVPSASNRQNLAYQWDAAGNLAQRQDLNQSLLEKFSYDALNRIQSSTLNGVGNLSVAYDASGNVTGRSDVGAYTYGDPAHPHAVTAAGSHTFTYDANGNQVTRDGASQAWATFNLPVQLAQPIGGTTHQSQFSYGPSHQRWRQIASYANGTETTLYVGGLLEKESTTTTGKTYWRHYVPTPSGMTVIVSRSPDASTSTHYLLSDHIGSSDAILDSSGEVVARESFAAFGARRGGDWNSGAAPDWAAIANTSRHGYTGHEHLDNLALIHMNGRVYDPTTGRFMSVDPVVGNLGESQTLNPYAYVGNRPLSYTDPSGYDVVCGGICTAVVISVARSLGSYIGSRSEKYVPPATALPGQSAQSGASMCGPGQTSPICGGWVLSAGARHGGSGVPSSSWAASERSGDSAGSGYPGEPGERAATAGMVLARDPNVPAEIKIAAPIFLAVGTGAVLFCVENLVVCSVLGITIDAQTVATSDVPAPVGGWLSRGVRSSANEGAEIVQRAMSRAELAATKETGLLRGGRSGTHYASDAVNSSASRARSRLALPQAPEVRATLEVPSGRFSPPSRVPPDFKMPGGGTQRTATGEIPVRILKVDEY